MKYNIKSKILPTDLRDMIDKPVMIFKGKKAEDFCREWDIIKRVGENAVETLRGSVFMLQDYDDSWAAFPYNPDIAVEDYEPCMVCADSDSISGKAFISKKVGAGLLVYKSFHGSFYFCPNCGRPLNECARKILNQRIGGAK